MAKLLMVVNEDRFFLSHRKPIAEEARRSGYETVIVSKDTGLRRVIENMGFRFLDLPINPTGMNPLQEFRTLGFLISLYRNERPDIVHHVGLKNILWGGLAARILGVGGVVNAVSGLGGLFNGDRLSLTSRAVMKIMKFSNSRKGVKVIFQNNDDLSLFLKEKVVNSDQVAFTKGSGIDLDDFVFVPEKSAEKLNIIFTARMVREKGVVELIKAAGLLKPNYRHKVRFILCGRITPNRTGISEEFMKGNCDGEYICWLGERNDIKELLSKSHIMAFPSYYREGVPKSLIEACAVGLPIVTCDSTGCRDVVENGINGFLVPPRDPIALAEALKSLIDNEELRKKMGKASRIKAEREFEIGRVVDVHMKIYNELTSL